MRRGLRCIVTVLLCVLCAAPASAEVREALARAAVLQAAGTLCGGGIEDPRAAALDGLALTGVEDRGPAGAWLQRRITFADPAGGLRLRVEATRTGAGLHRVSFEVFDDDRPMMLALADGGCAIRRGGAIRYDADGTATELVHLGPDLLAVAASEPLNPPVPPGADPGGVTVAQIDSGVAYTLPLIAARLARDAGGAALGYDFWDMDPRPFDGDTGRSPFFPIRHGTPVASVLLREAPDVRLVPYRYPRPDMARMADVVAAAAAAGAAVVAMPMGSTRRADWTAFEAAAAAHPALLFVVSAGDDGRDIDAAPLYPASLPLDNMIVVASADDFGRLAPGANWGVASVDLMVPGERVEVIDFRGARGNASGSSFAVPRVAALAARLKAAHPDWTAADLKRGVFARAVPPFERGAPRVAVGWIPNPADDG